MTKERISHMESCLLCGTTNSSSVDKNPAHEVFAEKFIELAVKAGDHKALADFAEGQLASMGGFFTSGGAGNGPRALLKLRHVRMARKALEAFERSIEPVANDEHRFDSNGHLI